MSQCCSASVQQSVDVRTKIGPQDTALCVSDVPNTFWHTLWSITVQTHDNVEYFCFIWNPCFYSPIDHVQEPIKKHVQFSLWYSLNIFYFCFEHCRLRWRWLCANWITLFLVNLEVNYKLRSKCQMSLTFRYCNPKHSSWQMLLSVLHY